MACVVACNGVDSFPLDLAGALLGQTTSSGPWPERYVSSDTPVQVRSPASSERSYSSSPVYSDATSSQDMYSWSENPHQMTSPPAFLPALQSAMPDSMHSGMTDDVTQRYPYYGESPPWSDNNNKTMYSPLSNSSHLRIAPQVSVRKHQTRACSSQKPKRKRKLNSDQRVAASLRERRRMVTFNTAFEDLKNRLPSFARKKRNLSRIDTLRCAMEYIIHLQQTLSCDPAEGHVPSEFHFKPEDEY